MLLPRDTLSVLILPALPLAFLLISMRCSGLFHCPDNALPPRSSVDYFVCSSLDLPVEAEPGDAAVPVAVVAAAAAAPVQPGEGAPEDAAGRAADGAPEAAAASAGGPLLLHAGHGARQAEGPEGTWWQTCTHTHTHTPASSQTHTGCVNGPCYAVLCYGVFLSG